MLYVYVYTMCVIKIFCYVTFFNTGECNGGMFSELTNCCNLDNPCNIGQGDCDTDNDCLGNLVCGKQNCGTTFFWNSTDCCTTLVG